MFTNDDLTKLITCPKNIITPPKKNYTQYGRHRQNGMRLQAIDIGVEFSVFFKQHIEFIENFSVGLVLEANNENPNSCILVRYNGPHGPHRLFPHHEHCHIHKINPEAVNNGILTEADAFQTTQYATFEQAIECFLHDCNIQGADMYFPNIKEFNLFSYMDHN